MSLKIKLKDGTWEKLFEGDYSFNDLYESNISISSPIQWPEYPSLKMSIHPGWLKLMDQLEVGDIVTTHDNHVGVITKVSEVMSLGMKKFEVLIGNKKEVYFSINLKKIEENNDES